MGTEVLLLINQRIELADGAKTSNVMQMPNRLIIEEIFSDIEHCKPKKPFF